jgi:hypothetical protein
MTIPLVSEGQGEAVGFDPKGWGYYTVSEGASPAIYYFDRVPHGDFNHNGTVDAADFVTWRKWLGSIYVAGDINTWRANFGQSAAGGGLASTLPEPVSIVLVLVGLSFVWLRIRL